jgi:ferrochelatase
MRHNYAAIGGRSPLTDITRAQASALQRALADDTPVFVGMRNWRPFVTEALRDAAAAGVSDLVAVPLAPQYSSLSVGKYREAVEQSRPEAMKVRFVESWHDHPGLLDAFAEKVRAARSQDAWDEVVFTAHSLPERVVREGDPYAEQVAATARGVAERAGLARYRNAYQSAGRTPEPWLGPSLETALAELAAQHARRVLVAPVGFVCDHTEVLFDIDVQARAFARARGMTLGRTESLNTSPTFIRALVDLLRAHRAEG